MPLQGYTIVTINQRPDLIEQVYEVEKLSWPEFINHDPIGNQYWDKLYQDFADYQLVMIEDKSQRVIASGNSIPLEWEGNIEDLPEEGWDWALQRGFIRTGGQSLIQCALSIPILPEYRGKGLSKYMVEAMIKIGKSQGLSSLIAPVRPNMKSQYPLTPIEEYVTWQDTNGLPFDAWLRVHVKLGAGIIKICHRSMQISGTVPEWEDWANMRFPSSGEYVVPGAIVPVTIDYNNNRGIYVEPNIWIIHSF